MAITIPKSQQRNQHMKSSYIIQLFNIIHILFFILLIWAIKDKLN